MLYKELDFFQSRLVGFFFHLMSLLLYQKLSLCFVTIKNKQINQNFKASFLNFTIAVQNILMYYYRPKSRRQNLKDGFIPKEAAVSRSFRNSSKWKLGPLEMCSDHFNGFKEMASERFLIHLYLVHTCMLSELTAGRLVV